jgi:hypothetical protein
MVVEQRAIAVVAAATAVGDDAGVRLRVILVLVVPAIPPPHRSRERRLHPSRDDLPPSSRQRCPRPGARSALLGRGALAAGAAWGLRALSLREEEEEGGAWRRLGAAGAGGKGGGQRRRRRRGEFGLNTAIFLRNYFLVRQELHAGALCGCCGGVQTTKYLPPGKRWLPVFPHFNQRSGSAVEAQRMRSGRGG